MPSEKTLQSKKQIVAELTEKIKNAPAGVLVNYIGINVADDTRLRRELREAGVEYSVEKNTLLRFAFDNLGLSELNETLNGTTALAVCTEDPMAAARIICKYAKEIEGDVFSVKAGFMDGAAIDAATVNAIAAIPSKEVLIAKMLGSLNSPIAGLAMVLNQIAEKQSA
ncbi:MAG: 50S ribosomal protein L10 [Oscillospiraceae bacterium]|nr:50S ribosomal protein L10 [Oscillospiraceae bacterium]